MDVNSFIDAFSSFLVSLPPNIKKSAGFFIIAFILYFLTRGPRQAWETAISPQKPSLKERPSPCNLTMKGLFGGCTCGILMALAALSLIVALLLFMGWEQMFAELRQAFLELIGAG